MSKKLVKKLVKRLVYTLGSIILISLGYYISKFAFGNQSLFDEMVLDGQAPNVIMHTLNTCLGMAGIGITFLGGNGIVFQFTGRSFFQILD